MRAHLDALLTVYFLWHIIYTIWSVDSITYSMHRPYITKYTDAVLHPSIRKYIYIYLYIYIYIYTKSYLLDKTITPPIHKPYSYNHTFRQHHVSSNGVRRNPLWVVASAPCMGTSARVWWMVWACQCAEEVGINLFGSLPNGGTIFSIGIVCFLSMFLFAFGGVQEPIRTVTGFLEHGHPYFRQLRASRSAPGSKHPIKLWPRWLSVAASAHTNLRGHAS